MPTVSINGVTHSYDDRGKGPPLVLIHGFPLDRRMWAHQVHELSAKYRVIAPDLRGFGESADASAFTIESLADDLHSLLIKLNVLPCTVGGLSMGGYIALAFARKFPADLKALLLIDTRADADSPAAREGRQKTIALAREKGASAVADQMLPKMLAPNAVEGRPEVAQSVHRMMSACPAATVANASIALRDRPDATPGLSAIAVPTLIVVGDGDLITPPAVAEGMQRAIKGSTLVEIRGAGHMSPMEQPAQVNRAIRTFLGKLK